MPIGLFQNIQKHQLNTLPIEKNEKLYVFTDGIIEAAKGEDELGTSRFARLIEEKNSKKEGVEYLIKEVSEWQDQEEFNDDITILEISYID